MNVSRSRARAMSAAFGVAIVLLVGVSAASYRGTQRLLEAERWSRHTQEVIAQLRRVLGHLADAETGERGFALTANERLLEPYDRARAELPRELANLRALTADNPQQQRRIDKLEPLIDERLRHLSEIVEARRTESLEAASRRVASLRGKELMDAARGVLAEMEAEEKRLQLERDRSVAIDAAALNRTLLYLSATGLVLIGLAFLALARENAGRARAKEGLRQLNAQLEERVRERTAQLEAANRELERDVAERQRLELTLRDSERRIRTTLDSMLEGCQIIGFDWRYLYINDVAAGHGRQSKDTLLGRTMMDAFPGIENTEMFATLKQCMEQRAPRQIENEFAFPDGSRRRFELSIEPVPEGLFVLSMDVTERARAEERREQALQLVRESEARYRRLVENIREVVFAGELSGPPMTATLTFVSPQVEEVTGRSPQDFLSDPELWVRLLHPEDVANVMRETERALVKSEPVVRFYRLRNEKTGQYRWIEDTFVPEPANGGVARGFFVTARDITERWHVEAELREAQERYRLASEVAHVGVWDWDLATDVIFVDPALKALLGFADDEIRNHMDDWGKRVHLDDREQVRAAAKAHLDGRTPLYEVEHRRLHRDGSVRHFLARGTAMRDASGKAVRLVGADVDVTERHLLEQQFRQAQKMEAVGRLAGGIAHDFNNLLGVITGYSELLLRGVGLERPEYKRLEQIRKAADRAAGLTRQLLAFSRKQVLQPKVLDLNAVVTDIEPMLQRLIGEDVQLVNKRAESLRRVRVDPSLVEQVIVNLAVNARDAMPRGGTLVLETADVDLDQAYAGTHPEVRPGPYVMLAVSDTGHGMDEATLARIYEPFFTTKEIGKGTGLGLATVYGIVKQSGGSIAVYSELARGTTFKVYLPATEGETEALSATTIGTAPRGSETVLLVEDEPALREVICEQLEEAGYAVRAASGLAEALSHVNSGSARVHLLLTDVVLPDASGREIAARVNTAQPGIRVLYMSGYTDGAIAHHGVIDAGVQFINKPFSAEALLRKIREVLDAT